VIAGQRSRRKHQICVNKPQSWRKRDGRAQKWKDISLIERRQTIVASGSVCTVGTASFCGQALLATSSPYRMSNKLAFCFISIQATWRPKYLL